jgi:hypothetical protein
VRPSQQWIITPKEISFRTHVHRTVTHESESDFTQQKGKGDSEEKQRQINQNVPTLTSYYPVNLYRCDSLRSTGSHPDEPAGD